MIAFRNSKQATVVSSWKDLEQTSPDTAYYVMVGHIDDLCLQDDYHWRIDSMIVMPTGLLGWLHQQQRYQQYRFKKLCSCWGIVEETEESATRVLYSKLIRYGLVIYKVRVAGSYAILDFQIAPETPQEAMDLQIASSRGNIAISSYEGLGIWTGPDTGSHLEHMFSVKKMKKVDHINSHVFTEKDVADYQEYPEITDALVKCASYSMTPLSLVTMLK